MMILFKKSTLGLALAATALTSFAVAPASAQSHRGHSGGGDTTAAAVIGGIVGLAIGVAVASGGKGRDRDYDDRYDNGVYYSGGYDRGGYDRGGYDRRGYDRHGKYRGNGHYRGNRHYGRKDSHRDWRRDGYGEGHQGEWRRGDRDYGHDQHRERHDGRDGSYREDGNRGY